MPSLTWTDTQEVAERLRRKFPELHPLRIRFTDLHTWVCELDEFTDDPRHSNEKVLENIQMAWLDAHEE